MAGTDAITPARALPDTLVAAQPARIGYALVLITASGVEVLAISERRCRIERERRELEDVMPGLEAGALKVVETIVI